MTDRLLVIDGYNIIYRAFFALLNSTGKTTSVSVFFSSMLSLIKQSNATHLVICMDSKGIVLRKKNYAEYKAKRDKAPPRLHEEADIIRSILDSFGISVISQSGYEADDMMHALCKAHAGQISIILASGDKDLLQLVNDEQGIAQLRFDAKEGEWVLYDEKKVIERFGLPPSKIASYLALVGDESDNIPGVPGIGEKSAVGLLDRYEDIDDIYSNLQHISRGVRVKLEKGESDARLSLRMTDLNNLEYAYDLSEDALERHEIRRIGFSSGAKALEEAGCLRAAAQFKKYAKDKSIWSDDDTLQIPDLQKTGSQRKDINEKDVLDMFEKAKRIALLFSDDNGGFQFSVDGKRSFDFHISDNNHALIGAICANMSKITTLDAKSLLRFIRSYQYKIETVPDDMGLESYLLDSTRSKETIAYLARMYLGENLIRPQRQTPSLFPSENEKDEPDLAATAFRIQSTLDKRLKAESLSDLYSKIEKPLIPVVCDMEVAGIRIDADAIKAVEIKLKCEIENLEQMIFQAVGRPFNIQSPKQLQDVLANDLNLALAKKNHTGYSTDQSVLEELAKECETVSLILEYKAKAKLLGTYVAALIKNADKPDMRIHTTFLQTGTQTGRFSSQNPNLQSIPDRTEEGRTIRKCFIASPGCLLISCDYSQIELRVLAHLSKDQTLCDFFNRGLDVHRATAAALKNTDYDSPEITEHDRRNAKTINFAIIYGMSAFALAKSLNTTTRLAQDFIDNYFRLFDGVSDLKKKIVESARAKGYVTTEFGRKRRLDGIDGPNRMMMERAERQALNSVVQGQAADIMKMALISVSNALRREKMEARLLLTVHDEIIAEAEEKCAERAMALIEDEMESCVSLNVPLVANACLGRSWGDL